MASTTCLAQSPGAKILVLEREQGEKRVRRPREKMPNPTSEFILKVTPQNSGSQHLVLGTETIPPGGVIPKHRHLGHKEVIAKTHGLDIAADVIERAFQKRSMTLLSKSA